MAGLKAARKEEALFEKSAQKLLALGALALEVPLIATSGGD